MRARCVRLAGVCLILVAAVACSGEPLPPMRIGLGLWPGNELLFLAEHRGWLSRDEFRLVEFTSGFEVIRAFRNRTIEAASMTLDEVVLTLKDGMDPVILIALDESKGADAVLARPGISKLSDLKGKRVGLQVNSVSAYLLRRALQSAGMTANDITVVNVGPERHRSWIANGTVDAVASYEPVRTQLLQEGAVELFNSQAIPGEVVDLLVVRRDYLEEQPERAAAIYAAWQRALPEMHSSAEAAQWTARRLGVTPEEYTGMLKAIDLFDLAANHARVSGPQPSLLPTAIKVKNELLAASLIPKDLSLEPLFQWPSSLTKAIGRTR